ncbi:unnamed protein product [Lampetra fluviatilis]
MSPLEQGLPVLKAFCTAGGDLTAFEQRFFSNCDMAGWTEEEGLCALPAILDDDSLAAFITIPRGDHATFQQVLKHMAAIYRPPSDT